MSKKFHIDESDYQYDYAMSFADLMTALVGAFLVLTMFFMYLNATKAEKVVQAYQQSVSSVENLVGVKKSLIDEIKKTFENSDLKVTIDYETGAIRFSDKIFFNYDSDVISPSGKEFLNKFIPKYMALLLNDNTRKNVSEIIVEGHTDNNGSYLYNLDLSQRRALAVTKYILGDEIPSYEGKSHINQFITSTGKSYSSLIYKNGVVDQESSRRVEFKFRLKEDDAVKNLQKMFAD